MDSKLKFDFHIGTLYNVILCIARSLLETRENIKVESHRTGQENELGSTLEPNDDFYLILKL